MADSIARDRYSSLIFVILLLCIQIALWSQTRQVMPKLGILDQLPSESTAKLASIADDQLYFRMAAIGLQNAGDSFGRFTALREYDYKLLLDWMIFMDKFDKSSHFLPAIGSYYYSNTQNKGDNKYVIQYLENRYDRNPVENWWWLSQGVHIALHRMEDRKLALRLAHKLSTTPYEKIPRWAQQMPAFILEQMGEREQALAVIKDLAERFDNYSQGELNFMNYFVKNRLGFLQENIDKTPKYKEDGIFDAPYMDE